MRKVDLSLWKRLKLQLLSDIKRKKLHFPTVERFKLAITVTEVI